MCSLVAGLTAVSGIMQYKAQQEAADNQASAYRAQAKAAEANAAIESRKVEQQVDNTAKEQSRLRTQRAIAAGRLNANAGASGLASNTGSLMDIQDVSNQNYLNDQNTLLTNERNQTYDTKVSAANYQNQANSYYSAANNTESQAKAAGFATLLGTAASIYGANASGWSGASTATKAAKAYNPSYSDLARMNRG